MTANGTVSTLEIIWVAIMAVITLVTSTGLGRSFWDFVLVKQRFPDDPVKELIGLANIRRDFSRFLNVFLFFVFGCYSLTQPPVREDNWRYAFAITLVTINALLASTGSMLDRRDRHRILGLLKEKEGGDQQPSDIPPSQS